MTLATIDHLERVGSHFVTIDSHYPHGYRDSKEELFPVFVGSWRGEPVRVQMSADRYRSGDSDTWADPRSPEGWRVYCRDAWLIGPDADASKWNGSHVSGTARSRLGEVAAPLVADWLKSPAYTQSRADALYHAIRRQLKDDAAGMYSNPASLRTRQMLAVESIARQMTASAKGQLSRACDALDTLAAILNEGNGDA